MPAPSTSVATLRPDLAGSFMQFDLAMDRAGFIASRVLPITEVASAVGTFGVIPIDQLLKIGDTRRAPGAGYSRGDFTFTTQSYVCDEHGWEEMFDDREANMYSEYFVAEQIATQRALDRVLRNYEIRVANLLFNTTTYTGASLTTAVGTAWSTPATATPITDVLNAGAKVYDNTGMWPNALVLNRKKWRNLINCTQFTDRLAAAGAGSNIKARDITPEMAAACFDLDYVIIAGASKDTALEGQTSTPVPVWTTTQAMVCRIANDVDIKSPCIGRTFHYTKDGSQIGGTVENYRDETRRSEVYRVRFDTAEKIIYTQMGHLLTGL